MRAYKLTDAAGQTHGETPWGPGVTHEAKPGRGPLCSDRWIHCYADPLMAVFMNPVHAGFEHPLLWECEASGGLCDDRGLKFGAKRVTTIRTIPLPVLTLEQRITAAIYLGQAGMESVPEMRVRHWESWADGWLTGADRSEVGAARTAQFTGDRGLWSAYHSAEAARLAAQFTGNSAEYAAECAARSAEAIRFARDVFFAPSAEYRTWLANFPSLVLLCLYAAAEGVQ